MFLVYIGAWISSDQSIYLLLKGNWYILAAIDYFSKWAKAVALRKIKASDLVWFIKVHIIYRFRVPDQVITNNGQPFLSSPIFRLIEKYNIEFEHSSRYYP